MHYRIQAICRVPNALGKGYFALGKAFAECSIRQRASGKKIRRQRILCRVSFIVAECPTLGKVGTEKNPKKIGKNGKLFLIDGGPHWPALAHLWHFSRKFRSNAADGI